MKKGEQLSSSTDDQRNSVLGTSEHQAADIPEKEAQVTEVSNWGRMDDSSRPSVSSTREWLSYAEATELVGLGRTTLWKLVGAGEIEAARVGRAVRINRESLTAYMKRSAEGNAVAPEEP